MTEVETQTQKDSECPCCGSQMITNGNPLADYDMLCPDCGYKR